MTYRARLFDELPRQVRHLEHRLARLMGSAHIVCSVELEMAQLYYHISELLEFLDEDEDIDH